MNVNKNIRTNITEWQTYGSVLTAHREVFIWIWFILEVSKMEVHWSLTCWEAATYILPQLVQTDVTFMDLWNYQGYYYQSTYACFANTTEKKEKNTDHNYTGRMHKLQSYLNSKYHFLYRYDSDSIHHFIECMPNVRAFSLRASLYSIIDFGFANIYSSNLCPIKE